MHTIEIYGFADREICAGCEGGCGSGHCAPGAKVKTSLLVAEFRERLKALDLGIGVEFIEATEEGISRNEDVRKILSMADLSPAIAMDGKLLFFGGFEPEGLVEEVRKRL